MAIVKTIQSGTATVHIDDSCCTGLSREEISRRRADVNRAIWTINRNHQQRMQEAQNTKGDAIHE